jgi:RNA polymerase sigma-70 factor (ECF subfamily)
VHRIVRVDVTGLATLRAAVIAALEPWPNDLAFAASVTDTGRTRKGTFSGALSRAARTGTTEPAKPARGSGYTRGTAPDGEAARIMALVELAQEGDGEAFAQLYDNYLDTVYRYIYYRVSSKALAEDLTQETFLRALRRISTFTWQGRDFGAWLVTIARNLVADHFKSSRFRLEVTIADMVATEGAAESAESPEGVVLRSLTNAALLAAVKRLNPQQQECLVLRFLQGLSVAETAKIMGKNEGAIKTLQYRAVRTLAQLLPEGTR